MGTDYRLYTASASLDLDNAGADLFNAMDSRDPAVRRVTFDRLKAIPGFDRSKPFWKGVWCFLRDHGDGKGLVYSEHDEYYDGMWDQIEGGPDHHFSVFSRKGHWKRLGYGPL